MKNIMWLTQWVAECRGSRPHTEGWPAFCAVIQRVPKRAGGMNANKYFPILEKDA